MKQMRGSIAVEAIIVMPFYILTLIFLANFLNVFHTHNVIQNGLNHAANTISQYCYAVDITIGMEKFALEEETVQKANDLQKAINEFTAAGSAVLGGFDDFKLSNLDTLMDNGKRFVNAASNLGTAISKIKGDDLVNALMTAGAEAGGGLLVKALVENYLADMKINRKLISDEIHYSFYVDPERYDLVLTAYYTYNNPIFSIFTDGFYVKQRAVVHPWIGGDSPALRKIDIGG